MAADRRGSPGARSLLHHRARAMRSATGVGAAATVLASFLPTPELIPGSLFLGTGLAAVGWLIYAVRASRARDRAQPGLADHPINLETAKAGRRAFRLLSLVGVALAVGNTVHTRPDTSGDWGGTLLDDFLLLSFSFPWLWLARDSTKLIASEQARREALGITRPERDEGHAL